MTKRKMPKQRRLAFESLESRTLLAIIMNGDRGFVEVIWDPSVPAVTWEQQGGPTIGLAVKLHAKTDGTTNPFPVVVSFASSVASEAVFSTGATGPARLTASIASSRFGSESPSLSGKHVFLRGY